MEVRFYKPSDYQALANLYKQSDQFKFNEVKDSEEALKKKIERDPESLLIAEDNNQIVGSVSIVEDGRLALLFRLVAVPGDNHDAILKALTDEVEVILKKRGFLEMHNTAPMNDLNALMERRKLGFEEGSVYTWFWKKIK